MIPRKNLLAQVFCSAPARQYYSLRNPPQPVNLKIDRVRFTATIEEVARVKQPNIAPNPSSLLRRYLLDSLAPPPGTPPYLSPSLDELGNLFIPLPCTRPSLPTILLGASSTLPTLSALEIARTLLKHPLHHPLTLALWTNSSARPNLGSATWAGELSVKKAWKMKERSGKTVEAVLEEGAWRGERPCSLRAGPWMGAYFQMVAIASSNPSQVFHENFGGLEVASGVEAFGYVEVTFKRVEHQDKVYYALNPEWRHEVISRMIAGAKSVAEEFGARITKEKIGEDGFMIGLWHPRVVEDIWDAIKSEWRRTDVDWVKIQSARMIMNEPPVLFGGDVQEVLMEETASMMGVLDWEGFKTLETVLSVPTDAAAPAKHGIPTGVLVVGGREEDWSNAAQTMLNAILEWDRRHSAIERIPERSFLE
ncbi:hypothetical protein FPQ18DRAFT_352799 [Pyronema domesticum]|uniref:Uncharacterized protein n=1 Tax=Pyronema omphalodes (strain CBS 100304) TaxID=1076935 RepID=U4LLJ4_PYROM|nr:hypothetical protein FPQ18DRAFT_352799 [Pyronema domesticum]CCX14258.1 Similar to hypothetical protein AN2839.2 [Aspergillus nidulans FGSC A4]; acc. no. XP_660443 [Pyronema omphalodes CBS 100304]